MGERGCSVKDISQLGDMKIAHASFVAFMAVCSNCAAFPNGQYVKRYKKSKIDDIVQLCNSLGEHTKKKTNCANEYIGKKLCKTNVLSKSKVSHMKKFSMVKRKGKNEVVTIEKCICGSFFKYINNTGDILLKGNPQVVVKKIRYFIHFIYVT